MATRRSQFTRSAARRAFRWTMGDISRGYGRGIRNIGEAKEVHPLERQRQQNLRKASVYGQQVSPGQFQPMYQQGQAQQSQAMGGITAQGLEGSIMAQDVSSRIDAGTRAAIAEQARQISFQNEQTKVAAKQAQQESLFKRRGLLEDLAIKKRELVEWKTDEERKAQRELSNRMRESRYQWGQELDEWRDRHQGIGYASQVQGTKFEEEPATPQNIA